MGHRIWIRTVAKPVLDGDRIVRVVGNIMDITERKQAEEALRKSKERYQGVVEDQTEIISRFYPDNTHTFVNDVYCRFFGKLQKEVIGKKWFPNVYPDDVEMIKAKLMTMSPSNPVFIVENRVISRKGDVHWMQFVNRGFYDHTGNLLEIQAVGRDITKRKQAEEALLKERDKALAYLDIAGVVIVVLNRDQSIAVINKKGCEILGYDEPEIIGKKWFDNFLPERDRDQTRAVFSELIAGNIEPVKYYENYVLTKDNKERLIAWYNSILRDDDGKIIATLSSGEDITERKKAEKRLHHLSSQLIKAQERERRRISLELHDEMGQALTAININLRSIEKELPLNLGPLIKEKFVETQSLVDEASEQIRELSHYLRPSMLDDLGLVPTLRWYLSEYSKRTDLDVQYKSINFEERPNQEVEIVVYRLVQESLNNIAKHAQAGKVLVRLERKEKEAVISIEDDGRGFDVNEVLASDDLKGRIGIMGMQERVSTLGGRFSIKSRKGSGTSREGRGRNCKELRWF